MENKDVKNNGRNENNGQRRRPPSQNGGRPQSVSSRSGSRPGQSKGQGKTPVGKDKGRPQGQTGRPAQTGTRPAGKNQNRPQGQQSRQRGNTQQEPSRSQPQKRPVNRSNAPAKRKPPQQSKKREEPIIRGDEYGDGFYTDEVELKRRRKRKEDQLLKAQQEIELKKEPMSRRTRKAINVAICAAIIAVVLITGVVLSLTVLFKSEKIEVEGATRYTQQQVVDASGLTLGENLFLSDKKTGGERIEEKLPYVEKAEVSIKIPDTIVVTITEAKPAYLIAQGKEFVVISTQGRVLERVSKNTYDAPVIKGCEITETKVGKTAQIKNKQVLSILNTITKALQKNKFGGVKEIDVTDTANITLNYSDRIKIILGTPDDVDYKIRTAQTIIAEKLAKTDMGVLDVSNCNSGKKASYYNPDSSLYPTEAPTQAPTEPQTEPGTEPDYGDGGGTQDWGDGDTGDGGDYDPAQDAGGDGDMGNGVYYSGEGDTGDGGYTGE